MAKQTSKKVAVKVTEIPAALLATLRPLVEKARATARANREAFQACAAEVIRLTLGKGGKGIPFKDAVGLFRKAVNIVIAGDGPEVKSERESIVQGMTYWCRKHQAGTVDLFASERAKRKVTEKVATAEHVREAEQLEKKGLRPAGPGSNQGSGNGRGKGASPSRKAQDKAISDPASLTLTDKAQAVVGPMNTLLMGVRQAKQVSDTERRSVSKVLKLAQEVLSALDGKTAKQSIAKQKPEPTKAA